MNNNPITSERSNSYDDILKFKPVEETSAWIVIESMERFFKEAPKAGMVLGEDYWVETDGSITSNDFLMSNLDEYMIDKYSALDEIGIDTLETADSLIEKGFLIEGKYDFFVPTKKAIRAGMFSIQISDKNSTKSHVRIDKGTLELLYEGPEGKVAFKLFKRLDLKIIWKALGSPEGKDPESWIAGYHKHNPNFNAEVGITGTIFEGKGDPSPPIMYLSRLIEEGYLDWRIQDSFIKEDSPELS